MSFVMLNSLDLVIAQKSFSVSRCAPGFSRRQKPQHYITFNQSLFFGVDLVHGPKKSL